MSLLRPIEEKQIVARHLVGDNINNVESKIKGLIDIAFSKEPRAIDYNFFDLKGSVLLHGIPGIGKTSIMYNCMSYALEKYETDCYEIMTVDIVEADLGKATKNLEEALGEFEKKERGVLFIDELDRLCVNRKADEISELKRMLIELMRFFDRQTLTNYKVVLCCTNVIEQIDPALIRRFSICEEIGNPTNEELIEFARICMEKAHFKGIITGIKEQNIRTFDDIKRLFRNAILQHSDVLQSFEMEDY